jgi:hypothetical protein
MANPQLSLQKNFNTALRGITKYNNHQPTNATFHNLCTDNKIPLGTKQLLGLNLKFCLAPKKLQNTIPNTIRRMAYNIRTMYHLKECGATNNEDYIKQIYIKNKTWNPPPAPTQIEDKLTEFEKSLHSEHHSRVTKTSKINLNNLTLPQRQTLALLKGNTNFTIKPTDKNLGPVIMDTAKYIEQVLKEHLLTKDYLQLSPTEAKHKMEDLKVTLKALLQEHQHNLSKPELIYFQRSLQLFHRLPVFYGLPKVHKSPMMLRPVVSSCGSLLSIFSTWLDFKMKELLPFIKSHLKNSTSLINDLRDLHIPQDALLFSADATSMYTNIDTATALQSIEELILTHQHCLPHNFPKNLFLRVLQLVMDNNIFSFGSSYWLQLSGTAMGTPAACAYATISYGHFENSTLLTEFSSNLLYYKRYIDDVFGIWLPPNSNKDSTWTSFEKTLNNWGNLKWVVEKPSSKTTFLDLNIYIQNSRIVTTTYQKDLNLYLYIPPGSAHPPGCLKGLINGELRRYWTQNPNIEDYQAILSKFITRLLDRGHTIDSLKPILLQAAARLNQSSRARINNDNSNTLYIHWAYQPNGLQQKDIRDRYNAILQPHLNYDHMQIAIARPRNLKDTLTRSALTIPPHMDLGNLIQQYATEPHQT